MDQKKEKIDMLQGPLIKNLLLFTLPIALGSMLQQLFNAADTSIVGYFGDADALAAVGTNGEIIALIVTLSSGLAIGANVLVASQIGQCIAEPLLLLIQTPDEIRKEKRQNFICGFIFLVIRDCFFMISGQHFCVHGETADIPFSH